MSVLTPGRLIDSIKDTANLIKATAEGVGDGVKSVINTPKTVLGPAPGTVIAGKVVEKVKEELDRQTNLTV